MTFRAGSIAFSVLHGLRMIHLQESSTAFKERNIFVSTNAIARASLIAGRVQALNIGKIRLPTRPGRAKTDGTPLCLFSGCLKQIGVSPCSFQTKLIVESLVDQNPIRLNMAVAMPAPLTSKWVIAIPGMQGGSRKNKIRHSSYFCEVFASFLQSLDVLLKLLGLGEPHLSHEA